MEMEISETERMSILGKKDDILQATLEILNSLYTETNDAKLQLRVEKQLLMITSALSYVASYGNSKTRKQISQYIDSIDTFIGLVSARHSPELLKMICVAVNKIEFTFSKSSLTIKGLLSADLGKIKAQLETLYKK